MDRTSAPSLDRRTLIVQVSDLRGALGGIIAGLDAYAEAHPASYGSEHGAWISRADMLVAVSACRHASDFCPPLDRAAYIALAMRLGDDR
jgi:hypothetical protein